MKSTQAMRDSVRELMSREQDDYDRAVECVLDDLEGMLRVAPETRSCDETTQSSDGGVEGHAQTVPWPTRGRAASDGVADQSLACTLGTLPPAGIKPGPSDAIAEILRRTFGADDVIATGCAARIVAVFPTTAINSDAVRQALFLPKESNATDNLEGALLDIKRMSEAGKPTDAVCIRTIERVIAQLTNAEDVLSAAPVSAWQDISTAPKDRAITGHAPGWRTGREVSWAQDHWECAFAGTMAVHPTLWQPLPAGPISRKERGVASK